MSSWPSGLPVFGTVRSRPVFGGYKPKIDMDGCRRTVAIRREQSLMDVKKDVRHGEVVVRFAASGLTSVS
jgi:hypothetical protein